KITVLDDPKGIATNAYYINNSNVVVGSYALATGFGNGFIYSGGVYTDVGPPNATAGSVAVGINDAGQVVGYFSDQVGEHGFVYTNGTYTTLDVPGALVTLAGAINNNG